MNGLQFFYMFKRCSSVNSVILKTKEIDHSCMICFRSVGRWNRGFESHSRHGCLRVRLFCICVVLCVGSGVATG
jgi:hypothetical protein